METLKAPQRFSPFLYFDVASCEAPIGARGIGMVYIPSTGVHVALVFWHNYK